MDDMEFARYSCDIRKVLKNMKDTEQFETLVRNVVAYAVANNKCKTNWIAYELFMDVLPDELIAEIFNE
ncbi:Uncharacterised protein [uncultured Eubacterium sp.]|nr:Uncharacterised protein [uncultured Eubacterium sp.]